MNYVSGPEICVFNVDHSAVLHAVGFMEAVRFRNCAIITSSASKTAVRDLGQHYPVKISEAVRYTEA